MTMEDFTAADNDRWKAIVATLRSKDPILAEAIDELRQYAADETEVFEEINLIALMWFNAGNASAPHAEEAQLEMTHKRFTAADNDRWKAIVATVRAEDPVLAEATDELRQYAADAAEVVEGLADVLLKSFNARLQRERDERGDR